MSSANKTRFEVQTILRGCILAGISALSLPNTEVECMEADQVPPTAKKNYIVYKLVSTKRAGWPKITYGTISSEFTRKEEFLEIAEFEIKVVRRLPKDAPVNFATESDYIDGLKAWFNGMGNEWLRERGVSNFLAEDSQQEKNKDDSGLNLKPGTMMVSLVVPKAIIYRHNTLDVLQPKIKPV